MHDGAADLAWDEASSATADDGGSQSRYGYSADLSEAQIARERDRLIPPRSTALAAHIDRSASPEQRGQGWEEQEGGDARWQRQRQLPTTLSPIDKGRYVPNFESCMNKVFILLRNVQRLTPNVQRPTTFM